MFSKKITAFILGISLITPVPFTTGSGFKKDFARHFARHSAWPISIVGHTLFWLGLMGICWVPLLNEIPKEYSAEKWLMVSLCYSLIGAAGIAGGRALSEYADQK